MPLLEVRDVTKRFGGLVAVNSVSFSIDEGEIVGLIGPNGAGKTTLFNVISGFYKPEAGRVLFMGRDITGKPPYTIAKLGIGRTFQIVKPLLNLTVLENVVTAALLKSSSLSEAKERASEVLEFTGLHEKRMLKASALNLVERKRLELSRALAIDPKLLLLDEVAAGLNPREVDSLLELLRQINSAGKTILMVEHVMRAVMTISQRVIVLHHGSKLAEGTPSEVASDRRVIEAYLGEVVF
ncbi:MAG: ABC transporter ATP-binding protein [Thermoproteota archaeon]|nr:MAG: ABC transporter ATP-binding protein [Candidatus Korarchaeota archaeon]RLG50978.1 MAG: ABC transporter ATP-binding protein [Candidatus Korarchaeota archaeon]